MNTSNTRTTNDTTLEDEYEMLRLDALPPELRNLAGLHALDQFDAVEPYLQRYQRSSGEEPTYAWFSQSERDPGC
jgi:hypothetical protein